MEDWYDIPGYDGKYAASKTGKIINRHTGRILNGTVQNNGYQVVHLGKRGADKVVRAHRLIALTFLGPGRAGEVVNHLNGIKTDNRVENLEWATLSQNAIHALSMGLSIPLSGEKCPWAKMTMEKVREIRLRYNQGGISQRALGEQYELCQSSMSLLLRGKRWAEAA